MRKLNYILRGLKVCHESYYDRGWAKRDWEANVSVTPFYKHSSKANLVSGKKYYQLL